MAFGCGTRGAALPGRAGQVASKVRASIRWASAGLLLQVPGLVGDQHRLVIAQMAAEHGGRVLQRATGSGTGGQPLEIQFLEFPSASTLDAFMPDDRRQALAAEWDRVTAKNEVIEVRLVQQDSAQ